MRPIHSRGRWKVAKIALGAIAGAGLGIVLCVTASILGQSASLQLVSHSAAAGALIVALALCT